MRSMNPGRLAVLSAAALLAVCVVPVATGDDGDVLRGPRVRQSAPPGGPSFAQSKDPFMRNASGQQVPYRMFLMAVRSLDPNRAPAEVALNAEQREAVRLIQIEHNEALIAYLQLHRVELEALLEKAELPAPLMGAPRPGTLNDRREIDPPQRREGAPRDNARRANPPDPLDAEAAARQRAMRLLAVLNVERLEPSDDPAVTTARARLAELRDAAPSPEEARAKIWATLSEPQRAHVMATIEKARREMMERRRAQDMTSARPTDRGAAPPQARPGNRRDGGQVRPDRQRGPDTRDAPRRQRPQP